MIGGGYVEKITDKIIFAMKKRNILIEEEIVRFGLEIILLKIIFLAVIAAVGILMNCFLESIIFTLSFSLLRQYGGGYHAESKKKCFVLSVLMLHIGLFIIRMSESFYVFVMPVAVITFFSIAYIIYAAPIDTPNKRLDSAELCIYGKRTRITVLVLIILSVIFSYAKAYRFSFSIMTGMIMEAYLMLKGQIYNSNFPHAPSEQTAQPREKETK